LLNRSAFRVGTHIDYHLKPFRRQRRPVVRLWLPGKRQAFIDIKANERSLLRRDQFCLIDTLRHMICRPAMLSDISSR